MTAVSVTVNDTGVVSSDPSTHPATAEPAASSSDGHKNFTGAFGQIDGGVHTHAIINNQAIIVRIVIENTPEPFIVLIYIKINAAVGS